MKRFTLFFIFFYFIFNIEGNAYSNDLPKLFGITISDKFYNYSTADEPLKEDKFSVQIFPPIKNEDFKFYTIKLVLI